MCDIPLDLDPDEVIARAVGVPYHFNSAETKLRPAAFRPKPSTDDLSVMRKSHMGANACKTKAKEIHGDAYRGFAALTAREIATTGATVVDSRAGQFCGHAHISQGRSAPGKDEPADPELQEQYRKLSAAARLYLDPEPPVEAWTGPNIV